MTLDEFLKLHKDGCVQGCVSIHLLPYDQERHRYRKTYFEEEPQEDWGGMYKVELCIFLKPIKQTIDN